MPQQDERRAGNLRELLEQHWLHCRHLENERAWFLNIYGLVMAGVLTYITYMEDISSPTSLHFHLLFNFLVILTFVGFFLTSRWVYAFECHREKVNILAKILWTESGFTSALDPTMNISSIDVIPEFRKGGKPWQWFRKFVNEILRTRYWFPLFYFIILLGFVIFSFLAHYPSLSKGIVITALVIAFLFGVRWYSSLEKIKKGGNSTCR